MLFSHAFLYLSSSLFFFLVIFLPAFEKWKKVKVAQPCPTLCDPMYYRVHGTLQARILERVAFPFSRGSSQPRDQTQVFHIEGRFFTSWATREAFDNTTQMSHLGQGLCQPPKWGPYLFSTSPEPGTGKMLNKCYSIFNFSFLSVPSFHFANMTESSLFQRCKTFSQLSLSSSKAVSLLSLPLSPNFLKGKKSLSSFLWKINRC